MTNNRPQGRNTRMPPRDEPDDYQPQPRRKGGYQRQGLGETVAKSFIRSIASSLGRIIVRAITGRIR